MQSRATCRDWMGDDSPLVFYASETEEGGKERVMEMERDSRCCEALPSYCLNSVCLIGLPPPFLHSSSLPSLPSQLWQERWAASLRGCWSCPSSSSQTPLLPPSTTRSPLFDWPTLRCVSVEKGEEQHILIHLMALVFRLCVGLGWSRGCNTFIRACSHAR